MVFRGMWGLCHRRKFVFDRILTICVPGNFDKMTNYSRSLNSHIFRNNDPSELILVPNDVDAIKSYINVALHARTRARTCTVISPHFILILILPKTLGNITLPTYITFIWHCKSKRVHNFNTYTRSRTHKCHKIEPTLRPFRSYSCLKKPCHDII